MFEAGSSRVQMQQIRGTLQAFWGEDERSIERRVRAQLPESGNNWQLETHRAGQLITYVARKEIA